MTYRQAKPREIAESIKIQVVEPCDLAETDEYRRNPSKLRKLIHDIRIGASSNAKWVASQQWNGDRSSVTEAAPDLLEALRTAEQWIDLQGEVPGCRAAADSALRVVRAAISKAESA